jgi:hypothetical protein
MSMLVNRTGTIILMCHLPVTSNSTSCTTEEFTVRAGEDECSHKMSALHMSGDVIAATRFLVAELAFVFLSCQMMLLFHMVNEVTH